MSEQKMLSTRDLQARKWAEDLEGSKEILSPVETAAIEFILENISSPRITMDKVEFDPGKHIGAYVKLHEKGSEGEAFFIVGKFGNDPEHLVLRRDDDSLIEALDRQVELVQQASPKALVSIPDFVGAPERTVCIGDTGRVYIKLDDMWIRDDGSSMGSDIMATMYPHKVLWWGDNKW